MGGFNPLLTHISTLLWMDLTNLYVWTTLGVTLSLGLAGFWDDYLSGKEEAQQALR